MLKYLETFYKSRYLVSEIAIASGRRSVTKEHWTYCAKKAIERNLRYRDAVSNVTWVMTPTKVTAHRELLRDYIPNAKFTSWAAAFLDEMERHANAPQIYFNPALISDVSDFFLFDSHWTAEGGKKYIEPVLSSWGCGAEILALDLATVVHQGNCGVGNSDPSARESTLQSESSEYVELFKTKAYSVPDFSIRLGMNPRGGLGRALIVHSSSYAYVRGAFRSLFSSVIEVFSPYVPQSVVQLGKFDHVVILCAERNAAVVYDGAAFGERITAALDAPHIVEISRSLTNFLPTNGVANEDVDFLRALGRAWLGE